MYLPPWLVGRNLNILIVHDSIWHYSMKQHEREIIFELEISTNRVRVEISSGSGWSVLQAIILINFGSYGLSIIN